jgi:ABC-type polysaccharide/polyol phosphate export permease
MSSRGSTLAKYKRKITPTGEEVQRTGLRYRFMEFRRDISRLSHLVRLELSQQVYGLKFGHLWIVLEPALMALTYYFIVVLVFESVQAEATFAKFLVAIIFWRSHAMLTTSAPLFLITKGHQYVEQGFGLKIAFLEFLTQEVVLFGARYIVLLVFLFVAGYPPRWGWAAGIAVGAGMFCFSAMLSTWLAMAGVYFKDLGRLVGNFVWLWWYLSPGLYSFGQVPEWARVLFLVNPFSYILPAAHEMLLSVDSGVSIGFSMFLISILSGFFLAIGWRLMKSVAYAAPQRL